MTAPALGSLIKVESFVSTTEYTGFDILGRVTAHKQTTDGEEYDTEYLYNLSGGLVEQTYPSGRKVQNVIDNNTGYLNMVQSRKSLAHGYVNYVQNFTYNAVGAVTSLQLGNGKWESTQFNSRLQPSQIGLGATQGATNFLKLDYSYGGSNNNGNVISQNITVPTVGITPGFTAVQNYTYDSLNRVKTAEETVSSVQTWKQAFTYDRYGNRNFDEAETTTLPKACMESSLPVVCAADRKVFNPTANPSDNRLSSADGYVFDDVGNTTSDPQGRTFIYDAENKQVEVKDNLNQTIGNYWYDGDGKRIKKYVPATDEITIFVYDAAGKLVADYSTELSQDAKVSYMTSDHLGSPRILTDENGEIISRRDFHPFGEEISTTERTASLGYQVDDIRQKFTTYERDSETDLDFAQARYYANKLGRFNTPDAPFFDQYASDPQTWNLYVYVGNNPLIYVDPTGLWKEVDCSSGKGKCWEAEEGDTFSSLAKIVGISAKELTAFFSDVNPNNIQIGHTFDISGHYDWSIVQAFSSIGMDITGSTPFNRDDPSLIVDIPREYQPDMPTGHPIKDNFPHFVQGASDGFAAALAARGNKGGAIILATGLRGASAGLISLFRNGSIRNASIINIRTTLQRNGFKQTLSENSGGYLFTNAAGEQVRIMRRNGGWDVRVRNKNGNYLDEFGNVGNPQQTHNIPVVPR